MKLMKMRTFGLACLVVACFGLWGGSATGGGCPPNNTCDLLTEDPYPKLCRSSYCGKRDVDGYCIICVQTEVPEAESG